MPQTMAQLERILKPVYEDTVEDTLNNETLAYNRINKTDKGVANRPSGGKYVEFALHITRNSGIGARNENEALPNAGYQGYITGQQDLKYQYGAIEITGQVFAEATSKYQSFVNAVEEEISRLKQDLAKDRNRQYFGNGSGKIATVVSKSGNIIVLDSVQHIQERMLLDAVVATNGTVHKSGMTIISIDDASKAVTVEYSGGDLTAVVAGDILVRKGSWNREWTGLDAIISNTTTLYGINPATTREWASHVMNNSTDGVGNVAGALDEGVWMRMADRIGAKGGKISTMYTTRGVQRAYWQLLAGQRRFTPGSYAGGYKNLTFDAGAMGPVEIVVEDDAPKGTCIFVDESKIKMYRPQGWKFMDRQGSMWTQKRTADGDFDAYIARMFEYSEIGARTRNTHGKVINILEDEY